MKKNQGIASALGMAALFAMTAVFADEEPWGWNGSLGVNGNANWNQAANWQVVGPPSGDDYPGEATPDTAVVTLDDTAPAPNVIQGVAALARLLDLILGDGHVLTLNEGVNVLRRCELSGDVDLAGDSRLIVDSSPDDNEGYVWIFSEEEDSSLDVTGTGVNELDAQR